jgi:tetratricopeptide (TPR) repeat protein
LIYGFQITSTNAHNTFIQFFATGGVFLGVTYLVLNGFILKQAVNGLKNLNGNSRLYLSAIFSAWVAFHAQSLVSIDNIGISIWGWVLGGAIIGLTYSGNVLINGNEEFPQLKRNAINLSKVATSGCATILAIVLVVTLYRGESNSYNGTETVNLQDPTSRTYFKDLQLKVINTPLNDPTYKLFAASRLIQSGFVDDGLQEIYIILADNPRNQDALNLLALTFEQLGNIPKAIEFREKIVLLDPWNAENYLALGIDYKKQGNLVKSDALLSKILSFASTNQIADQAKKELGS